MLPWAESFIEVSAGSIALTKDRAGGRPSGPGRGSQGCGLNLRPRMRAGPFVNAALFFDGQGIGALTLCYGSAREREREHRVFHVNGLRTQDRLREMAAMDFTDA